MAREHPHSGQGLFSKAQGKKLLFFNQVEDEAGLNRAEALVSLLPGAFLRELSGIIIGSVQQNRTYPPRRVHHPLTK
jgi:hypothetical protein